MCVMSHLATHSLSLYHIEFFMEFFLYYILLFLIPSYRLLKKGSTSPRSIIGSSCCKCIMACPEYPQDLNTKLLYFITYALHHTKLYSSVTFTSLAWNSPLHQQTHFLPWLLTQVQVPFHHSAHSWLHQKNWHDLPPNTNQHHQHLWYHIYYPWHSRSMLFGVNVTHHNYSLHIFVLDLGIGTEIEPHWQLAWSNIAFLLRMDESQVCPYNAR